VAHNLQGLVAFDINTYTILILSAKTPQLSFYQNTKTKLQ